MEKSSGSHIVWVDVLRVVACFMVVVSHSCDFFVSQFDADRVEFLSGAVWGSMVRACVPLFVMISGVLLLPVRGGMAEFYSRRLKKVVVPLVFWSVVLPLVFWLYFSVFDTGSPNFAAENHTLGASLRKIATFVFNFNYDTTPFWYLYMLIGLYLFMPVIGAWLAAASKKEIGLFLKIWVVSLCLPYIQMAAPLLGYGGNYGNSGLWGVCDWNPYGMLYYFSGFLGYIVLAYYLVRFPLSWSVKRTLGVSAALFAAGYAVTLAGFLITQKYFPGSYSNLEIVWYFSGINVMMMTLAIFMVIQKVAVKSLPLLDRIAGLTFGIYLCHFVVVQAGYDLIHTYIWLPPWLQIPMIAIFSFAVSMFLVRMLGYSRVLRRMVGA